MNDSLVAAVRSLNLAGKNSVLDSRAVQLVKETKDTYASMRSEQEEEWGSSMRAYLKGDVPTRYRGRSDLRIPMAFILNERLIPRVVAASVGRGDFFDCHPKTRDQKRQATLNRDLINYQLYEEGFREKYTPLVRSVSIYGTGVVKRRWRYELAKVSCPYVATAQPLPGPDGVTTEAVYETQTKDEITFNGPVHDQLDIYSVFVNPMASCVENTNLVEEREVSLTWLRQQERQGLVSKINEVVEQFGAGKTGSSTALEQMKTNRDNALSMSSGTPDKTSKVYNLKEYWGEFALNAEPGKEDEAEMVQCKIMVINDSICIHLSTNPFPDQSKPYLFPMFIQVPGRFYGLSLTATNLDIFVEKNDLRNMSLDATHLSMVPMMTSRDAKMKGKVLEIEPGRVVVDPTGTMKPLTLTDTSPSGYQAEARLDQDVEDSFGAPPTLSGQPLQGGGGSATEVAAVMQESNVRIASYAFTMEETFLKKMLKGMASMNKKFLHKDKIIRITGRRGFEFPVVTPKDVQAEPDFFMLGSSQLMTKIALSSQYNLVVPMFQAYEAQNPGSIDMKELLRMVCRSVLSFEQPDLIVPETPDEFESTPTVVDNLLLIAQGHSPVVDTEGDLLADMKQVAQFLIATESRMDPQLEEAYRDYFDDIRRAAELKAQQARQVAMAQMAAQTQAPATQPATVAA